HPSQVAREGHRLPEAPQVLAARGSRTDARQLVVGRRHVAREVGAERQVEKGAGVGPGPGEPPPRRGPGGGGGGEASGGGAGPRRRRDERVGARSPGVRAPTRSRGARASFATGASSPTRVVA